MTSDPVPPSVPSAADAAADADADAVLRPSRAAYARAFRANLWIAIPLLLISLVRVGFNPWLLPALVIAIIASLGGVMLYFRNARIEYRDGSYTVFGMFGQRRTFRAAQAKVLITITSLQSIGVTSTSPQLFLIGQDDRKILRLRGQTWEVEQFTQLALDLIDHGVTNDAIREPITPAQLRARYPKAIAWWEAHPIAFGLLLGVGAVAVVIVGVLGVGALLNAALISY